jgi:hypothetical protein
MSSTVVGAINKCANSLTDSWFLASGILQKPLMTLPSQRQNSSTAGAIKGGIWCVCAGLAVHGAQAQQATALLTSDFSSKAWAPSPASVTQAMPLSTWLLSQTALEETYPLGLVWTTPEEKARQSALQKDALARLERLRTEGRISAQTWLSMQRMMRALPPNGRVRLAAADAQWLLAMLMASTYFWLTSTPSTS